MSMSAFEQAFHSNADSPGALRCFRLCSQARNRRVQNRSAVGTLRTVCGLGYFYGDPNIPDVRRFSSKLELQHELYLPGRKAFDQLAVTRQSELASHVELTDASAFVWFSAFEALDSKLKQRSFVVHRNGLHDGERQN